MATQRKAATKPISTRVRFHTFHTDIDGLLPPNQTNRYLVTVIDCVTRWPEVNPVRDSTISKVAKLLIATWILRFEILTVIGTDRDQVSCLENVMFTFRIKRQQTTVNVSQAADVIEAFILLLNRSSTGLTIHLRPCSTSATQPTRSATSRPNLLALLVLQSFSGSFFHDAKRPQTSHNVGG